MKCQLLGIYYQLFFFKNSKTLTWQIDEKIKSDVISQPAYLQVSALFYNLQATGPCPPSST